jgi:hypothetical protein
MPFRALLLAVLACLLTGGCGSDDVPAPKPVERKEEKADKLPQLERGYEEFVNRSAGVAFGRPPGWSAKEKGSVTTLTAPDELVSAAITIDRTDDALGGDPEEFATQTLELLPGYTKPLEASKAKSFDHPYSGAIAEAKGVSKKTGVPQRVSIIVLERKGVAVVTAVIAENAERKDASAEAQQAEKAVKTLRTRPPD